MTWAPAQAVSSLLSVTKGSGLKLHPSGLGLGLSFVCKQLAGADMQWSGAAEWQWGCGTHGLVQSALLKLFAL